MKPKDMKAVIGRKRYDTKTATLIVDNAYWDGHNFERSGRNTFLYRTPNGGYFAVHQTCWQGERDSLEPLTVDEAVQLYEELRDEGAMDFEKAFPGVKVEEA
jgi:hypothetical protein